MTDFDTTFPPLLAKLHQLEFDYADGEGMDFEQYEKFQSAEENADWIKAWTGNQTLTGSEYRIFGQDGTGGYAAFWLVRDTKDVLEQPIVFFGSEGEIGVVARNFTDYLWLLAEGVGPLEGVSYSGELRKPTPHFAAFAKEHAPSAKKSAKEVVAAAKKEFPQFEEDFQALCG
jgi:hypothetical protein